MAGPLRRFCHPYLFLRPGLFRDRIGDPDRGSVRNWHDIRKAYWFLALTVGLVTPLICALARTAPIDVHQHELDLITHYATLLNGRHFGILVVTMAFFTLSMAVNTAFVASSELLERVA